VQSKKKFNLNSNRNIKTEKKNRKRKQKFEKGKWRETHLAYMAEQPSI
jgi:hypothetical protein